MDTLTAQMIVSVAREIQDEETVFVGMRGPLLAFALAKRLHAPGSVGLFEAGIVRDVPSATSLHTMADPANVVGASWLGGMADLMGLMAQGHVDVGLIGGAQVDRWGNLNTSYIGGYTAPTVRLPGSGGASDIASLARRTVLMVPHQRRRFVAEVDYLTSPGHGAGVGWRAGVGLPPHAEGPAAVITTLGVLRFDATGEMVLASIHRGATVEQVQAHTGWPLKLAADLDETKPPTEEEWEVLGELEGGGT